MCYLKLPLHLSCVGVGLRGVVSIVMSLVLEEKSLHEDISVSPADGRRMIFIVGGVVTLSLVINASLAQHALSLLG